MDLQDYLHIVRKYLWASLLGAVVFAAAGLWANWELNFIPLYSATSAVLVGGDVATVDDDSGYIQLADQYTTTYADLATREPILSGVIQVLGLDTTPKDLADFVSAEVVEGTQLVEITASDRNPAWAAAIANETARQLVLYTPPGVRNFVLLVELANPPTGPSFAFLLIPVVAGVLGFLLIGGLTFLIEFLRNPVYSADEVSRRMSLPVLATIRGRSKAAGAPRRPLPRWRQVNDAPWWPLVQACTQQIETMESGGQARPPQVMVASATPGDRREKAIVAANLAAAWARNGSRVVLVDADLNSPLLAKWLKVPQKPGLAELIDGQPSEEQIKAALHATDIPGLSVLPVGAVTARTYDLLNSESFQNLLSALSKVADAVVVDGPAVLTGGEGPIMAKQVQGVLLTMKSGRTPMEAVADARDALTMAQTNLWGAILVDGLRTK